MGVMNWSSMMQRSARLSVAWCRNGESLFAGVGWREIDLHFPSNSMEYDRGVSFPLHFPSNLMEYDRGVSFPLHFPSN